MSSRPTKAQRDEVFKRAKGLCEYCKSQEKYSNAAFEVEHIIPISQSGETILENLALACSGCNKFKSNRTSAFDVRREPKPNFTIREKTFGASISYGMRITRKSSA
jgi:5-methylcytosine-specific restriction endonuclease McrA